MIRKFYVVALSLGAVLFNGCENAEVPQATADGAAAPGGARKASVMLKEDGVVNPVLAELNEKAAARGLKVRIHCAEYLTASSSGVSGQTVYANDRTKRLTSRWVPGDARRLPDGNNLTYLVDKTYSTANAFNPSPDFDAEPAIDAAMRTWDVETKCSSLALVKRPDSGANPNFVIDLFTGTTGANPFLADITNTGFLPAAFFDAIFGADAQFILAVCWTLTFVDDNGNPSDINGDGYIDTGLKEVWYNERFTWSNSGQGGIDVETVALHENGHALEADHFGKIFETNANGKIHFAPLAVMNASYSGVQRSLRGTDLATHCSTFGSWPNK